MSPTTLRFEQAVACVDSGCGIGLVVVDSGRPHPKHVAANILFAARI